MVSSIFTGVALIHWFEMHLFVILAENGVYQYVTLSFGHLGKMNGDAHRVSAFDGFGTNDFAQRAYRRIAESQLYEHHVFFFTTTFPIETHARTTEVHGLGG